MTLDEHLLSGVEHHPLEPFLPENAVLLMLGSFPPQKKRWSMDFFYPNLQNDMWRIFGFIFFDDKDYFLTPEKIFDKERIIAFLREKGIALYDTASCVRRLQDNASDKFLEVVSPTDIGLLLQQLPSCRAVVTTGQKATDVFCEQMEAKEPPFTTFFVTFSAKSFAVSIIFFTFTLSYPYWKLQLGEGGMDIYT